MDFKYKNLDVNYKSFNDELDETIIFLHGWGQNIEMMEPLGNHFIDKYRVVIFDLPGFGLSSEPDYVMTIDDYVDVIHEFVVKNKIKNLNLVGHSFGGKISLLYASKYKVNKLVLLASAFKKEIESISLKTKILKGLKKVPILNKLEDFAKRHIGSVDYRSASAIMRTILVDTVNYDISYCTKDVSCPTFLIWGENDSAVPVKRAKELNELIKDSYLVIYPGCTHYAYLEDLNRTVNIIESFIGEKND